MGQVGGSGWWASGLVGQVGGLVGQAGGLVGQNGGSGWWIRSVGQASESGWWVRLVGQASGLMGQSVRLVEPCGDSEP